MQNRLFKLVIKLFKNYYKSRNTRLSYYNLVFYLKKESNIYYPWAMDYMEFLHDETYRNTIPIMKENSPIPPSPTPPTFITLLDLTPAHRIMSLYFLIELQMEIKDWKYLNNTHEEVACNAWRVLPVGYDRWGCTYWLFDDSRLFREAKQEVVDQFSIAESNGVYSGAVSSSTRMNRDLSSSVVYQNSSMDSDKSVNYDIVKDSNGGDDSISGKKETKGENHIIDEQNQNGGFSTSSLLESFNSTAPIDPSKPQIKLKLKLTRPTLKPPTCTWQLVCKTKSEWTNFSSLFCNNPSSGNFACADEKAFYEYLVEVVPLVIADIEANEIEKKKRKRHERDWDVYVPPPPVTFQNNYELQQVDSNPSGTTLSEQFQIIEQSVSEPRNLETKKTVIGATRNSRKRQMIWRELNSSQISVDMPPKKRTPSTTSSNGASPTSKAPIKAPTPVPDIPPTSPVTPSKSISSLPKKHVKIHPETQVETFEIDEPILHASHVKETVPVAANSPSDKKIMAALPSTAIKANTSSVVSPSSATASPAKSAPLAKTVAPIQTKKHPKYYRDEATIKSDNNDLEKELLNNMGEKYRVWFGNTLILLPEKSDISNFEVIRDYCKNHPNATRSEAFGANGARPNGDVFLRICRNEPLDSILIYRVSKTISAQNKTRYEFLNKILEENCIVTIETGYKLPKEERIVRVAISFERLCSLAEQLQLKMPLKKNQITKHIKEFEQKQVTPTSRFISLLFHTYKYAKLCKEKRSVVFEMAKIKDFENADFADSEKLKTNFFTPAKRNYLLHSLLQKITVTNTSTVAEPPFTSATYRTQWTIDDLLVKKVFLDYQPLHGIQATELAKQVSIFSVPSVLELHDYFGDDWGFYFAFVEFYQEFCFRMFFPGVIMIAWSVFRYSLPSANTLVTNPFFGKLAGILGVFDNASIPAYAFAMNVGGLLFLKFWKRRNNCLAFLWDSSELKNSHKNRAEWTPSAQKQYSFITGEMTPFESHQSRFLRTLVIAFGAVDVVIYAYVTNNAVMGTDVSSSYGVPGAIGIVAIVACVHLLIVEWILNVAVAGIVRSENHKKEKKHRNRFISSQFFLQLFNSFSFLLFMSLARPMMSQSMNFNYFYGPLKCNVQGLSDTCLQELVILVFVMFIVQQFLHLVFCWFHYIFRRIEARRNRTKKKTAFQMYQKLDRLTPESLSRQYSDRILQFGNLVLFAFGFPLGPFLAILNNYFQARLDIRRFLNQFNRQWAEKRPGIGMWERWITFLVYLSIVVNGLSIPYISDGFYWIFNYFSSQNIVANNFQYSQVGFFIVYVSVLTCIAAAIHFWVPNVPRQVEIGIKAEKQIALKRSA